MSSIAESPKIRSYFDAIAFRYDFLNQFLSFKLDDSWRKRARDILMEPSQNRILDLGIGTGKFLELFLKARPWDKAVGLDFSSGMLKEAREQLPSDVRLVSADFQNLPFENNSFDLVISAFTLRSVQDMKAFMSGVYRILENGGKAGFLCLTRPTNIFWKILYYPYLKFYLPLIGGVFSGNKQAYKFLSNSIMSFQSPEDTAAVMSACGFRGVAIHRFSMGMATMVTGRKHHGSSGKA